MKQFQFGFDRQESALEAFEKSRNELEIGLKALCQVFESENVVKQGVYPFWNKIVKKELGVDRARIKWIWRTLMSDSHLGILSINNAEVFSSERIEVLQDGTLLVLVVTAVQGTKDGPKLSEESPPIVVNLKQTLCLKSASSGNLDCKDCNCVVYIPVAKQLLGSEAVPDAALPKILSVMPQQISKAEFKEHAIVAVEVQSINQAYTVASRLIETGRRSPGGPIFSRTWCLNSQNKFVCLSELRNLAEDGEWKMPKINVKAGKTYDAALEHLLKSEDSSVK